MEKFRIDEEENLYNQFVLLSTKSFVSTLDEVHKLANLYHISIDNFHVVGFKEHSMGNTIIFDGEECTLAIRLKKRRE